MHNVRPIHRSLRPPIDPEDNNIPVDDHHHAFQPHDNILFTTITAQTHSLPFTFTTCSQKRRFPEMFSFLFNRIHFVRSDRHEPEHVPLTKSTLFSPTTRLKNYTTIMRQKAHQHICEEVEIPLRAVCTNPILDSTKTYFPFLRAFTR